MTDEITLPAVADEHEGPDRTLIAETLAFVQERMDLVNQAFESLDKAACTAKVEIGQFLFDKYFNSDESLIEENKHHPYKEITYKALLAESAWPFKETSIRNMLKCAVQAKWLKSQRIRTDHLGFTHLVRLTRLPNDDQKKALIREIKVKNLTTRQLESAITQLKQKQIQSDRLTSVDQLETIGSTYSTWLNEVLTEDFKNNLALARGSNPSAVTNSLRSDMRKPVDDLITKLEQMLKVLLGVKETLKPIRKPRTKPHAPQATNEPAATASQDAETGEDEA